MSKGTQYSLYMNESFLDDVGEYMCKANNEKGAATSKAYLIVKGEQQIMKKPKYKKHFSVFNILYTLRPGIFPLC